MKKFLLFFGLLCSINLMSAQQPVVRQNGHGTPSHRLDATITAADIEFWVGTGNTEVIFVGSWCSPDVALAWGVRFNGSSTTVEAVMDTIMAYDSRFGYSGAGSIIYDVTYQDANYNLVMSEPYTGYIMYNVNGTLADFGYTDMYVSQNDLIKVGNTDCATMTGDPSDWSTIGYEWTTTIIPASPLTPPTPPMPEESTIDFSDIIFWVGEGSNQAVMAVNWADTALAWGYRWDGTATVADMMADIATADPRFSYEIGTWGIDDILFVVAEGDTLRKAPYSYWESKNNGVTDMGMGQTLANNDFEKWAEPAAGIVVDSMEYGGYWYYSYVYQMTIYPVSEPTIISVDNYEMSRVYAYPNPCVGTLNIINENAERIELYDMNGKLLEVVNSGNTQTTLNMHSYASGLYLLRVGNNVQKILKK